MTGAMRTASAIAAAAATDPGLQRDVNEDRVHADLSRGVFMVIDGVGGHAAGGKAADIALTMMRTRLERETGAIADRVREAIAIANNEIHRAAALRPEWNGMACVLTVAVVDDTRAIVGHVGDTRLYKLRGGRIEKITRDHSPVGEREDAGEISELEAMRHPRRNEVYRDVGSDPHQAADPDFIDLLEIPFELDAALLLCSDGLTDVIESSSVCDVVDRHAGRPDRVVNALVDAANNAGGKDNVSVVYVEGEHFATGHREAARAAADITRRLGANPTRDASADPAHASHERAARKRRPAVRRAVRVALIALLAAVTATSVVLLWPQAALLMQRHVTVPPATPAGTIAVGPGESIAAALQRAGAGTIVLVEPGEYRETLELKDDIRVVSRVPRGAVIRLPGAASEASAAVVAAGVKGAQLVGFRIIGDAATPLGTGVLVRSAEVSIVDVEVTGATDAAIAIGDESTATLLASDIHDNPGAALTIGSGPSRIEHNVFRRNGGSERVRASFVIDEHADARFSGNLFFDVTTDAFGRLTESSRGPLVRDNWFGGTPESRAPSSPRPRRGR
jgi:PPM family protein phosphatase